MHTPTNNTHFSALRRSIWVSEILPIIERAPSAELRPDQLDEDSLGSYAQLDPVLEAYVELDRSREELVAEGFDPAVVDRAIAMIDRAEYKRRQAAPGVKISSRNFGRDRRYPVTNRFREDVAGYKIDANSAPKLSNKAGEEA